MSIPLLNFLRRLMLHLFITFFYNSFDRKINCVYSVLMSRVSNTFWPCTRKSSGPSVSQVAFSIVSLQCPRGTQASRCQLPWCWHTPFCTTLVKWQIIFLPDLRFPTNLLQDVDRLPILAAMHGVSLLVSMSSLIVRSLGIADKTQEASDMERKIETWNVHLNIMVTEMVMAFPTPV